jgi:glyoxylase-like metal-dependent hydrolase (beta-lactamase superfamily II)
MNSEDRGSASGALPMSVRVTMVDTGFCIARASLVARGTGWQRIRCHAPAFVLQHPVHGMVLFDTGYAPRLGDAFAHWPDRLYKYATPTTFGTPVVQHLTARGVPAADVSMVIVSHLHADHVAGLRDFPAARFVVSDAALRLQQRARGVDAVRRGIVQALFPDDFAARAHVIDTFAHAALPHLGSTHDLFGDDSVRLMRLPGHARGQIGALVRTARERLLLCADGAWTSRSWRELRPPHWLTGALQDDLPALRATLQSLHHFAAAHSDVTILPTHCPDTLRWVGDP